MSTFIALNDIPAKSMTIDIPTYGAWSADVVLVRSTTFDTSPLAATVTLGDLVLKGTIVRSVDIGGALSARVVGGAYGWRKPVPPKAFHGVDAQWVATDTASEVGEQCIVEHSRSLGPIWVRIASSAAAALEQLRAALGAPGWWIDNDGVTHIGERPTGDVGVTFQMVKASGAHGRYIIATDSFAAWVPGRTFESPTISGRIGAVTHIATQDAPVRTEVLSWEAPTTLANIGPVAWTADRLKSPMPPLEDAVCSLRYFGLFSGSVVGFSYLNQTVSVKPDSPLLPSYLEGIPIAGLPPGVSVGADPTVEATIAQAMLGKVCYLSFANGDPSKPRVVGFDPMRGPPTPTRSVSPNAIVQPIDATTPPPPHFPVTGSPWLALM